MKALVLTGEGYGNIVMSTPLMAAVADLGYEAHVLVDGNYPDAAGLLVGWDALAGIWDKAEGMPQGIEWDVIVGTAWRSPDHSIRAERYVAPERLPMTHVHEAEINMTAAYQLGYSGPMPPPHVESGLPPAGLSKYFIAICPGYGGRDRSLWQRKAWPHWAEFTRRTDMTPMIIGAASDVSGGPDLPDFWRPTPTIRQAAGVLSAADCVISVDNGLAHIAAALKKRTIVLFGGTSEVKNRPLGRDVRVVAAPLACRPCQFTERWRDCADWRCMASITPEMVMEAMK